MFATITGLLSDLLKAIKSVVDYLNRKLRWTQLHDIQKDKEKLAALAADGSPSSMLIADQLATHISEESELLGDESAAETHAAPPRAIPVPGGDTDG